ncbi:MAG: HigA family addiction module antitoxin [Terracidiphilus sp.]|jgi:addiction module HigA family antidote
MMEKIPFGYSIHPGDILKTEFMEPLGLSSYRLAKELHVSAPRVNDLVRGKRSITADTAMRLSAYFGNSAQFWLNLQNKHDLWVAAKNKSLAKVKPREQAA